MIVVDTSALIDALTGRRRSAGLLRRWIEQGERFAVPTLVIYEWLRGPRNQEELQAQAALFPPASWIHFGAEEAQLAAKLYQSASRGRGREIDLAIAACAILHHGSLWTMNLADFRDLPGLHLEAPLDEA